MMHKTMGGGSQQLDLVMHKTRQLRPIAACELDEIVNAVAYDVEGDGYDIYGCDMRAFDSCY